MMFAGNVAAIGLGAVGAAAGIAVLGAGVGMIANEANEIIPNAEKELKRKRAR
jgi:hypothetical protein